jgi:hypothetical protein
VSGSPVGEVLEAPGDHATELRTGPRHLDHDVLGTGAVTETDDAPPAVRQAEDLEGGRDRVVVVRPVGPPRVRTASEALSGLVARSSVSLAHRAVTPWRSSQ